MSEPKARADRIQLLNPWLYHWSVLDDRIGDYRSDAYAVLTSDGKVLIDPLPLAEEALAEIGKVAAICLTGGQHQRSAWRYRKALGVPVYVPEGAVDLEEEPDESYRDGDSLPGGFKAIQVHGLGNSFALLMETEGGSGALFCGDLLVRDTDGPFQLLPDEYLDDPALARESAHRLAQLQVEILCPAHGVPCLIGCGQAIQKALEGKSDQ
ncbi:MAG: MBL fold metallo-hydrolase [Fidelibacterota bacterium]|nr:MAG: MBL fold metallo-hydrolase [Candidatus Neomarinimicrobiota bacterium]